MSLQAIFPSTSAQLFTPRDNNKPPYFVSWISGFIISALLVERTGADVSCFSALSGFGGHQAVLQC